MTDGPRGCLVRIDFVPKTMRDAKAPKIFLPPGWLLLGAVTLCALVGVRSRYELALVVGKSMLPTLSPGDLLIVDKKAYRLKEPERSDVVLVEYRKDLVIKRIIALPGEEVEVRNGHLYINGISREENHLVEAGPLTIQKGKLLMGRFATLGDNRSMLQVQAVHPIVSKKNIVGKVVFSLGL